LFRNGDSTNTVKGKPTSAPVTASPTIAPVVTPNDKGATTVQAGVPTPAVASSVTPAATPGLPAPPSAGTAVIEPPQMLLPISTVTPSMASSGIGSIIEQNVQRATIARSTWSQYEVEIHKKFSLAVACIVFVLLGAPIALRFPRGGVGLVIGASLGVFALYYVCLIAGESMADDGVLPPWVAMWAANLLFTVVGLFLFARMGRESSTARGGDWDEVKDRIRAWVASFRPSVRRQGRGVAMPATDR
jgi:lipopolysaccharide export system permease protein